MKLLSCKVDGFGCLRDRFFDFSSNPVCIMSDNGTGKTTLTVFIKSMLYGLTDKNDRKKYTPWDGGTFGGTLEFESSKGRFRIERYFGKKASDDRFKLINLETGLESDDYSENIGVELFGIDADSYAKSTYMPQGNKDFSATTSITTKLGELIEASDDAKSFDSAVSLLEDYMRDLKLFKGRGGLIAEREDKKYEIEKKITDIESALSALSEKRETLENYEKELAEIAEKSKELDEKRKKIANDKVVLNNIKFYEDLKGKAEEKAAEYERAVAAFGENAPTENEVETVSEAAREVVRIKSDKNADFSELDELKGRLGDISTANTALKKVKSLLENPKKPSIVAYVAAIVGAAAVAAVVGAIVGFTVAFWCVAAGTLTAVSALSFILYRSKTKKIGEEQKNSAEKTLVSLGYDVSGGCDIAIGRFESDLNRYSYLLNIEQSAKNEIFEKEQKIARLNKEINDFLDKYGVIRTGDVAVDLKKISDAVKKLPELKKRAEEEMDDCEKFAKEHGITDGMQKPDLTCDPTAELDELARRSNMISSLAGSLKAEIKALEEKADELPLLRYNAKRICDEIAEYTEKRETAETALQYLRDAKTSLSTKYLGKTKANFGEVFEELTGKTPEFDVDANFGVSFKENGGYRDSKVYSEGMRSIFAICMRLSLAKSLFGDEPAFLILDDPFTDLDGEKLARATAMLQKLSENYQIIYTTCHESRKI